MQKCKVIILGAGMAGICAAIKLQEAGITSFRIIEEQEGIGGTWRENTYPGVACDIPSHLYSYSFAANPDWSRRYAGGSEILSYLEQCADEYDLLKSIDFNSRADRIEFLEDEWQVTTSSGKHYQAEYVVSALGGLHTPSVPEIPGAGSFTGPAFHTSNWQHEVDLQGKRVAIVGTGATAVQAIPEVAKIVDKLMVFQRTPIWVLPKNDRTYSDQEMAAFRNDPDHTRDYRQDLWHTWEGFATKAVRPTPENVEAQKAVEATIAEVVNDPITARALTPNYRFGCKRPTLSNDYYQTFNRNNVTLITSPIEAMDETGLETDEGAHYDADVVIFATGFKAWDIRTEVSVVGLNGLSLDEVWRERISAYNSVMVPNFPNFFTILGPNSAGLSSALEMIEAQTAFVTKFISYVEDNKLSYMYPKTTAVDNWLEVVSNGFSETIMNAGCKSWWTDKNGYNHAVWPYGTQQFTELVNSLKIDDFVQVPS